MIYSPRFTVILDACVLYPAPVRDILLSLANENLYSPKWSNVIHDEWSRNLLINRPELNKSNIKRTIAAMDKAFPDALVHGFEPIIDGIDLPDPNDKHVLAAAIRCNADVIVTFNLKDFPVKHTKTFDIEIISPDNFIKNLFDLNKEASLDAFKKQVARLKNPPLTEEKVLESLAKCKLKKTAELIRNLLKTN